MRRHFENGHNKSDYACVGDYKPHLYSGRAHTYGYTKVPRIDSLRVVHTSEVFH